MPRLLVYIYVIISERQVMHATVTTIERTGISSYWQVYCRFNSCITLLILHEENPLVTNGLASPRANKANTLMCNSKSTFASSILCNIKQYFHYSDVICASWASPSLATLMFVHQPVRKNTKENNKAPHRWFPVRRIQQRPMESPHKGPAMWKALIMQFQYFRSTYDGKTHFTQQWKHMHILGFHLTGNSIVYSTIYIKEMQENIKISHYWSFLKRIHWWPMDSPHKGPAMRKASIMQFQGYICIFVSSILWKNFTLAATVILNEHHRISYQW